MEKEKEKEKPGLHDDDDDDGAEDDGAVAMDGTAASSSSPSWWWLSFTDAHPCSLLQHVVRACAGCLLGLCGADSGRGDRRLSTDAKDAADDDPAATSQRDAEGGSKATHDWAGARLLARRRPPPGRPGGPRPGRGGGGGSHN